MSKVTGHGVSDEESVVLSLGQGEVPEGLRGATMVAIALLVLSFLAFMLARRREAIRREGRSGNPCTCHVVQVRRNNSLRAGQPTRLLRPVLRSESLRGAILSAVIGTLPTWWRALGTGPS